MPKPLHLRITPTLPPPTEEDADHGTAPGLTRILDGLYTCTARDGWSSLAKSWSTLAGGVWVPRDHGLTWRNGSKSLWVIEPRNLRALLDAREVATRRDLDPGYSYGQVASHLLSWVTTRAYFDPPTERLLECWPIGYHDCYPGHYPNAINWDATSYYHTLLTRLPSFRPHTLTSGKVIWETMPRDESRRWQEVLSETLPHKTLRNSLWGTMLGSVDKQRAWHRGQPCMLSGYRGSQRAAAIVLGSTAGALCRKAACEVDSVHGHTDSVMTVTCAYPQIWDDWGFRIGIKGEGACEVQGPGIYIVGGLPTKLYEAGARVGIKIARRSLQDVPTFASWAKRAA